MLNCSIIMGRLTDDPTLKQVGKDSLSTTSFFVAVDRDYVKPGMDRETDFIKVEAWKGQAEFICKYFKKGSMISVQGPIRTRNYEDANGVKKTEVKIVAEHISFCGKENNDNSNSFIKQPSINITVDSNSPAIDDEDELPF